MSDAGLQGLGHRQEAVLTASQPLLSIIITCYNYETYVEKAIISALSQSYDNLEVIVIDDGSCDNSWEVIRRFSDRLKAIRTKNMGSIAACLTGFIASSGDYVMFLDADDLLDIKAISLLSRSFDGSTSKIQFCMQPIDAQGNFILAPFPRYRENLTSASLIESINNHGSYTTPPTSGNIYRRDVYEHVGDVSYDVGIDGVSYLIAPFVGSVISVDNVLGYYRIHGNNRSNISNISSDRLDTERRIFLSRLQHLSGLVAQYGTGAATFSLKSHYLYSTEREVYSRILSGNELGWRLRSKYLGLVCRELSGLSRIVYFIYCLSVIFFPSSLARRIISFRIDSSKSSFLRDFFKTRLKLRRTWPRHGVECQ